MGSKPDVEKRRFWQRTIREAARSGLSTREFCRQNKLQESQFYWWQRRWSVARQSPCVWQHLLAHFGGLFWPTLSC